MRSQQTSESPNGFTFGELEVTRNIAADGSHWVAVDYRGVIYSIGPTKHGQFRVSDYHGRSYYRIEQIKTVRMMLENGYNAPQISTELCLPIHCVTEITKLIRDLSSDS